MKFFWGAILLLIGWQTYHLGYKNGLRSSPEYAYSLAEKAKLARDEEMTRLESMLANFPTKDQCVPIMAGVEIDEYEFCNTLMQEQALRDGELDSEMSKGREQDWGR